MKLSLAGKNAVVMAASRGLGRGVAEEFARSGANVAICSRDEVRICKVAQDISETYGVRAIGFKADVSKGSELREFIQTAGKELGSVDILVTNAGGPPAGLFTELDDDRWIDAFNLNLLSVVRAVRESLPFMKNRPGANIMCIISSSVKNPISHLVLSNSLRPGIVGLAKTLSLELADLGIRVNCLAPGRIDTERVRELDRIHADRAGKTVDEIKKISVAGIPLGRYGDVEEFAHVAVFLASEAARFMTGQTLFVDGGMVRSLM